MIETTLPATSEKLWPGGLQHLGRTAQFVGAEAAKNGSIASRPSGVAQVAARGLAALARGWSGYGSRRRNAVSSSASRSFRISIRKLGLGR